MSRGKLPMEVSLKEGMSNVFKNVWILENCKTNFVQVQGFSLFILKRSPFNKI